MHAIFFSLSVIEVNKIIDLVSQEQFIIFFLLESEIFHILTQKIDFLYLFLSLGMVNHVLIYSILFTMIYFFKLMIILIV